MKKLSLDELNRIDADTFRQSEKIPLIVILDNIRSMNNIGSVFRSSDAFRLQKIWLCGITATPPNREISKTALGATESVDWGYADDTVEVVRKLQQDQYKVFAVEQCEGATELQDFVLAQKKTAIVMGNEVKGVQQRVVDACDGCIEIPQFGTKHSLNVSVSTGILVWDLFLKYRDTWEKWK